MGSLSEIGGVNLEDAPALAARNDVAVWHHHRAATTEVGIVTLHREIVFRCEPVFQAEAAVEAENGVSVGLTGIVVRTVAGSNVNVSCAIRNGAAAAHPDAAIAFVIAI